MKVTFALVAALTIMIFITELGGKVGDGNLGVKNYSSVCVNGVEYYKLRYGISVRFDTNGKIVKC